MDEAVHEAQERFDRCRQKFASALEVADDLKAQLAIALQIKGDAKQEYDDAWVALRVLVGRQAWEITNAIHTIGQVPLSSPPPSTALGSDDAWPSTPQPVEDAEPWRRMIAGVEVPPRPPPLDFDSFQEGCQS